MECEWAEVYPRTEATVLLVLGLKLLLKRCLVLSATSLGAVSYNAEGDCSMNCGGVVLDLGVELCLGCCSDYELELERGCL